MNYTKYDMGNYNLYLIKNDKFKTISLSINFRRPNTREDEVKRAILTKMLPLATAQYPSLDKLCQAKAELYTPSLNLTSAASGQERWICLESSFVNEKYTEPGMNAKTLAFIMDYIWHPYIVADSFDPKIFDICRHEYIESLRSLKDDADKYSRERAWEEMQIYDFKEMLPDECIEFAKTLTAQDLYQYYLSIFEEDCLDIFITGQFDDEKIKTEIAKHVKGNFKPSYKNRFIIQTDDRSDIKKVTENSENEQSKLIIGLKYIEPTDYELRYVSLAYNNILGGGWNSKLNKVVREENSLCYYIFASRKMTFGIAFINSGIDKYDVSKALELIKKQMEKMRQGEISEEELQTVKDIYHNAIIDIEDNQFSILSSVIAEVFNGNDNSQTRLAKMDKVTIDDIASFAKKVKIDTIYLLEGGNTNAKENL